MRQQALAPTQGARSVLAAATLRLLERDAVGASLRFALLSLGLLGYWFGLTLSADPRRLPAPAWIASLPFPADILASIAAALFAPEVLRHVIPVGAGLWLALRLGAHYLADLFEIESLPLATRYLRGALFGLDHAALRVTSGEVKQLDWTSPLLRVGGPGHLSVELGFAAAFETPEGHPRIYGPSRRRFIHGFERLRDVVDLRDQVRQVDEVPAITRDGIEVSARDVQMVFHVHGGERGRSLDDPYPYTDDAVRRLIYGQPVTEQGPQRWTEALPDLVRGEIAAFVAGLTIEEFLALQPAAPGEAEAAPPPRAFHIPRRQLTERFHTPQVRARLQEAGLELDWVGVGTWQLSDPAGAEHLASETMIHAWQGLQRARLYRSEEYLQRQRARRERESAGHALRGWVDAWEEAEAQGAARCWALLTRIRSDLEEMRTALTATPQALPIDFDQALHHLARLTRPRELGSRAR